MKLPKYKCRACYSENCTDLLNLGEVPLANDFVNESTSELDKELIPLNFCMCKNCNLIQIKEIVPPSRMFKNYLWQSGTSKALNDYVEHFSEKIENKFFKDKSNNSNLIVEIASNDGSMLRSFKKRGFKILGIDPSSVASNCNENGIPTINNFFSYELSKEILDKYGPSDLVIARNVIGHVSEPRDLVKGIKNILSIEGHCIIESPYVGLLREQLQYDTIFHEHVCYFSIKSLSNLLNQEGLQITNTSFCDLNGGSFVAEIVHSGSKNPININSILDLEDINNLNKFLGWEAFKNQVNSQKIALKNLLIELNKKGKKVVAYGAAAKFMTMLNVAKIDKTLLKCVGDLNPSKQGLLCPGVHIPVVSPEELMSINPDYILIGAWNFRKEIIEFFKSKYNFKKEFIIPLPLPSIIN